MIVDMHCDTISRLAELRKAGKTAALRSNAEHLDLLRMKEQGYLLQNLAMFVFLGSGKDPWETVCELHRVYQEELQANQDLIAAVRCYEDIQKHREQGKMSVLLTVEEGAVCKGELEKLRQLYDWGVRMMTLTWNFPNELGYPNRDRTQKGASFHRPDLKRGLTETGREFVTEMERMGMIVDVSHASDAVFFDVLEMTHKPFVASHSNAREVCPHVRNLTDDMLRKLAERGGCCGLNFCADFLLETPETQENEGVGSLEAVVRHAKHIVNVAGIEVLGLGSDFDGIDTNVELPGVQSMEVLWDTLHHAGFTQNQLDQIFYQNVLRVYRDCL